MKFNTAMIMISIFLLYFLSSCGVGFCASFPETMQAFEQDFKRINPETLKSHFTTVVENLSGMKINKPVPIEYRPRGDVKNEWVIQELGRNNLKDNFRLEGYEYLLNRFQLLDLKKPLNEILLTYYDDIYGLYDPHKKSIVFMMGINQQAVMTTLFHELMHAAQDSAIDLIKYQEKHGSTIDEELAASALIEGQASSLQLLVQIEKNLEGKTRKEIIQDVIDRIKDNGTDSFLAPDADIINSLQSFPYNYGLLFVLERIIKDDSDFSGMFKKVPISTEQILHIEKFETNELPLKTALNEKKKQIAAIPDVNVIFDTSLGEYYINQIFNRVHKSKEGDIDKVSAGWGGDRIFVMKSENSLFFIWDTLWDSRADANEFYQQYLVFSKNRSNADNFSSNEIFNAVYNKEEAGVYIKIYDNRVLIIEGQIKPAVFKKIQNILDL